MGLFGPLFGDGGSGGTTPIVFPGIGAATTIGAIRDRAIAVIHNLTPNLLTPDKFKAYLNEGDGDFRAWCASQPQACQRRFQIRTVGIDAPAMITNGDYERRRFEMTLMVAYAQTSRAGKANALSRDDLIDADRRQIEQSIGMTGRLNFCAPWPDACWISATGPRTIEAEGYSLLVITQTMEYIDAYTTFPTGS